MESKNLFKSLIKDLTIHKEPCNLLTDCINSLPKNELKEIAVNLRYSKTPLESIPIEFIKEQINNTINALYYFTPCEVVFSTFKFLTEHCKLELPFSKVGLEKLKAVKENSFIDYIGFLVSRCIIFAFEKDDDITYVVPCETAEYLSKLVSSDPDLEKVGNKEEFHYYVATLAALYGVCPAQVFILLWNRDHTENQFASKEDFKKQIESCYLVTTHFNLVGSVISSPELNSDNREQIKEKREGLDVYMPAADEIQAHFGCYDYDDATDEFKTMEKLIFSNTKNKSLAEEITYTVVTLLKIGVDITQLKDYVEEKYDISFDKKSSQQFNRLIIAMGLTFHLWSKWGNTGLTGMMNLLADVKNGK